MDGTRYTVAERRALFERADELAHGVRVCERCGLGWEEALCVYAVDRVTRATPHARAQCLCEPCADKIAHGHVLSS